MESSFVEVPVRAHRLGLTAHFATNPVPGTGGALFMTSSALRFTDGPLAYGMSAVGQDFDVVLGSVGDDIDPHALSIMDLPPFDVLDGPLITVEGVAPGLEGAPTVGIGNPVSQSSVNWVVLGATASTVTTSLVDRKALEADLYLRAELVDTDQNRIGARPRMSMSAGVLLPLSVPHFLVPGEGQMTGGDSYPIEVADVIEGAGGLGLYRVVITNATTGRRWHVWTLDPAGAGNVRLALPPVAALGGTPHLDGPHSARVSAWSLDLPNFAADGFLWADVDRRHEAFGHSKPTPFTQNLAEPRRSLWSAGDRRAEGGPRAAGAAWRRTP
jgi:hypothetical protein